MLYADDGAMMLAICHDMMRIDAMHRRELWYVDAGAATRDGMIRRYEDERLRLCRA